MESLDFKKQKDAEFLAEHELDDDAFERLIENKFKRARAYYDALHKREEKTVTFD